MLSLRNIAKNFGGLAAVRKCSYRVTQGSITCLIGPNGAGKTTTFNLISGFERADAGEIHFGNDEITDLAASSIARLGLVRTFQIPRELNDMSVLESLKLAPINDELETIWAPFFQSGRIRRRELELEQEAIRVLELVGLLTKANDSVRALSGGQKKLLELARGVMAGAKLLLLDEPTAGVSPALIGRIGALLQELKQRGMTMLIVEHNMEFVRSISDHVIVMAEGTPLVEGTFEQIRIHPSVADAYLGREAAACS